MRESKTMKPREQLEKEISITIRESFQNGFDSESVSELDNFDGFAEAEETLQKYAIGRWVPVSERLPNRHDIVITRWSDGSVSYYTFWAVSNWAVLSSSRHVTHWLDLELPEVGE